MESFIMSNKESVIFPLLLTLLVINMTLKVKTPDGVSWSQAEYNTP